jgi:hypothetical protein
VSAVQTADARLVALSQEFQENDAQFKAWDDERDNLPHNHPRVKEIEKLERAVVEHGWKMREEVFELEAHTAEGMQAKARMVLRDLEEEAGLKSQSCNHSLLAAVSLARDVLKASVAEKIEPHPDAELISTAAATENAERQIHKYNRDVISLTEAEVDEHLGIGHESALRLIAMRPITQEGLLAKARAFQLAMDNLIANIPGETVESMGEFDQLLAWSLVGDILGRTGV